MEIQRDARPGIPSAPRRREMKDQFLAGLNFELRTPLSGIVGMTDLLMETPLTDEQKDYVTATRTCAENLLEMLSATLELSQIAAGNIRLEDSDFDLAEALRAAMNQNRAIAHQRGLRLICGFDSELPAVVRGDAMRLRELVSLLIRNAAKSMHGGEMEVVATSRNTLERKLELAVRIRAMGDAIPPERQEALLGSIEEARADRFQSLPDLGLSLALAFQLARVMRGVLEVETHPGRGFSFLAVLPMSQAQENSGDGGLCAEENRKVLVVDDNDIARRVVAHMLRRGGFEVECATGAEEAFELAQAIRFRAVLMDLQMPGADGFQATEMIRGIEGYEDVPIFAITANTVDDTRLLCKDRGMAGFLTKPIRAAELMTALERGRC